jgi:DNA (cytosine-5)-methyltransferase 1
MGKRIPIISLFSGGGFMDMGFINAGFDVVFANEYDRVFAELHDEGISSWARRHKKKSCPITSTGSLSDLTPEYIIKTAFPKGVPDLWGIIGGPPCQDFTMRGNGEGFKGTRGKMTHVFFERIMKMKPSFFVMENVVGLLMRKKPKQILDTLLFKLLSEHYYLDRATLNALDYGVPQYRKRVFIIGLRKDQFIIEQTKESTIDDIKSFIFTWPTPRYPNAISRYNWPDTTPFGANVVLKPKGVPKNLCVQRCVEGAEELPNGNEFFAFNGDANIRTGIDEGDTKRRSFKRLHRYRYSPTTCFGNNEVFLHPYENRRLSVREALRIQSVDDKYVWGPERLSAKFKIIGNGVPVLLAEAVAKELYTLLVMARDN